VAKDGLVVLGEKCESLRRLSSVVFPPIPSSQHSSTVQNAITGSLWAVFSLINAGQSATNASKAALFNSLQWIINLMGRRKGGWGLDWVTPWRVKVLRCVTIFLNHVTCLIYLFEGY